MAEEKGTVCVTGAGGYVASWLVKLLLSNGYSIHGTVRDPCKSTNPYAYPYPSSSPQLSIASLTTVISLTYQSHHLFNSYDYYDEKNSHLKKLEKASDKLKLFKVDLLD
ncbi:cinnamoyl-CoA reductase 2-like [Camellia sinensis]|uniref:cinnamoyl-CoA reductase 2-like n=1 Tax=Camellia sinensis TaxID=4442 RepID=UPI001035BC7D|nr:cinnamoyl-CoA reductase 2-like [Camellia sinensis]